MCTIVWPNVPSVCILSDSRHFRPLHCQKRFNSCELHCTGRIPPAGHVTRFGCGNPQLSTPKKKLPRAATTKNVTADVTTRARASQPYDICIRSIRGESAMLTLVTSWTKGFPPELLEELSEINHGRFRLSCRWDKFTMYVCLL